MTNLKTIMFKLQDRIGNEEMVEHKLVLVNAVTSLTYKSINAHDDAVALIAQVRKSAEQLILYAASLKEEDRKPGLMAASRFSEAYLDAGV